MLSDGTTISAYTTTFNPLIWQSTIFESMASIWDLVDEIIILDGGSTDGFIEKFNELLRNFDRIKLHINTDMTFKNGDIDVYRMAKQTALDLCVGDICVLFDSDECLHEDSIEIIKQEFMNKDINGWGFNVNHFYRDWNRLAPTPQFYPHKMYAVRNGFGKHVNVPDGDIDGLVLDDQDESKYKLIEDAWMYHYGWCRDDPILAIKKLRQDQIHLEGKGKNIVPQFESPENFEIFKGKHPKVMSKLMNDRKMMPLDEFTFGTGNKLYGRVENDDRKR